MKLRVESDYDMLINYVKRQDCEIVENIDYMSLWYKLKAPVTSNGLSMSNLFYESGYFEEVDSCFMFNFKPNCINEPNYSSQWGLHYLEACSAWNITKGSSTVIVAVLDSGIEQAHNEFSNNFNSQSYDLINRSSPSVVRSQHGTHVAGIIGANQNGMQISGIAPNVSLLSISHD